MKKLCLYDLIHHLHDNANLAIFDGTKLIYLGQAKDCYKKLSEEQYERNIETISSSDVNGTPCILLIFDRR